MGFPSGGLGGARGGGGPPAELHVFPAGGRPPAPGCSLTPPPRAAPPGCPPRLLPQRERGGGEGGVSVLCGGTTPLPSRSRERGGHAHGRWTAGDAPPRGIRTSPHPPPDGPRPNSPPRGDVLTSRPIRTSGPGPGPGPGPELGNGPPPGPPGLSGPDEGHGGVHVIRTPARLSGKAPRGGEGGRRRRRGGRAPRAPAAPAIALTNSAAASSPPRRRIAPPALKIPAGHPPPPAPLPEPAQT